MVSFDRSNIAEDQKGIYTSQKTSGMASASVKKTIEKSEELIDKIEACGSEENASMSADEVEEQIAANTGRQAEILEQLFGEEMGVLAAALETLEMEDADEATCWI